jgi:hypothetical protein
MSQDRRLKDILNDMDSEPGYAPERIVEAKQAILEVMRGCVPEEAPIRDYDGGVLWNTCQDNKSNGWNACRAEVLRRIEEVGK